METVVDKVAQEVKDKWAKVLHDHKKLSIEKKIQKIIDIPLKDVKNIIVEKKS